MEKNKHAKVSKQLDGQPTHVDTYYVLNTLQLLLTAQWAFTFVRPFQGNQKDYTAMLIHENLCKVKLNSFIFWSTFSLLVHYKIDGQLFFLVNNFEYFEWT